MPRHTLISEEAGSVRVKVTLRRFRLIIVAVEQQWVILRERESILCVSLVIQRAKRMRRAIFIICGLSGVAVSYFSTCEVAVVLVEF